MSAPEVRQSNHNFSTEFGPGDKVLIDGDRSIVGTVTACLWRQAAPQIEVCWFSSGAHHSFWFDPWRPSARTGETMGACQRAASLVAQFDKMLQAHNALGELLGSGRQYLTRSEQSERAGLADDATVDWGKRLAASMRAVLAIADGDGATFSDEARAAFESLRGYLPRNPSPDQEEG
ncbi:MAG: hypothetical protein KDJ44_09165 [Rhodoblastus sp.]|nr:hypothetical protein [Rhodoblastus sp.]